MKLLLFIISFLVNGLLYAQYSLPITVSLKRHNDLTTIIIKDSLDGVNLMEGGNDPNLSCSDIILLFEKDSLIDLKFNYPVFGHITKPINDTLSKIDVSKTFNDSLLTLFLYFEEGNVGARFYYLQGFFQESIGNSYYYNFIPTGLNQVKTEMFDRIYFFDPKNQTHNVFTSYVRGKKYGPKLYR